jgi:osmotically-inducible protein OsmY
MPPESDAIPDEVRRKLAQAASVAKAVDDAITKAEPTIFDLQVAADPIGRVVISGVVPTMEAAIRAGKTALKVEGVKQLLNSLTVLEQGPGR